MSFPFVIAHATDGRTRIRWAGDDADRFNIVQITETIDAMPGIDQAEPRMATGSIIIEHPEIDWVTLESDLVRDLSLQFVDPSAASGLTGIDSLNRGLDKLDYGLKRVNTDLPSLTVLLLAVLAIVQSLRGQVMANSISFLWYAISIAAISRKSPE